MPKLLTNIAKPFLMVIIVLILSPSLLADTIKIGIKSINSFDAATAQWKATSDYLSKEVKGFEFEIVLVKNIEALSTRTGKGEFDFVITMPSSYIIIEKKYGASRLLTLQNKRQGKPYTEFGSVIFTKNDRNDITKIEDLKNKTLIVNSPIGFGGWLVAWRELLKHGFNPHEDLKKLIYSTKNSQLDVIKSVLSGKVDAGVARTDMLERLDAKNIIDIRRIKVLGQKQTDGFPFLHSTQLYPEWAFVKAKKTSNTLAKK